VSITFSGKLYEINSEKIGGKNNDWKTMSCTVMSRKPYFLIKKEDDKKYQFFKLIISGNVRSPIWNQIMQSKWVAVTNGDFLFDGGQYKDKNTGEMKNYKSFTVFSNINDIHVLEDIYYNNQNQQSQPQPQPQPKPQQQYQPPAPQPTRQYQPPAPQPTRQYSQPAPQPTQQYQQPVQQAYKQPVPQQPVQQPVQQNNNYIPPNNDSIDLPDFNDDFTKPLEGLDDIFNDVENGTMPTY